MRENNLIQNISWYCWPSFPQSNFYIHCYLKIVSLTKIAILIVNTSLVIKVWSQVLRDSIHRLPNLTIWAMPFFNVLARSSILLLLTIQIIIFPFFSLSFLKVCFHTIPNKSKNIVFHVNFPPCLVFELIDFRLQSLAISPRYYLSGGCLSSRICKFHCFG